MVAPTTPVMDLAGVVDELATGEYTVTRRTQAAMVNGRRQAPTTSTITTRANVQPLRGLEVANLPEGVRNLEALVMYTVVEMKAAQDPYEPDLVTIDGATYEVSSVERWNLAGNFWRSVLVRSS